MLSMRRNAQSELRELFGVEEGPVWNLWWLWQDGNRCLSDLLWQKANAVQHMWRLGASYLPSLQRFWYDKLTNSLSFDAGPLSIFYPVLNQDYARQIARDWNTKDAPSGYAGYVTKFAVNSKYLAQYEIQTLHCMKSIGFRLNISISATKILSARLKY